MSGRGVAIVGAGRIAQLHARNAAALPGLHLVAIADPVPGLAQALANETGAEAVEDWQALLERPDVDALVLCSPSRLHAEHVETAAAARKHVLCEKPLATELAAADRAVAAAEAAGIVLQVGYNRRFDRNFAAVRKAVAAGRVGKPVIVRVTSRDPEPAPRPYLEANRDSLLLETTTHDFDLARFVTGAELVEVSTRAATLVSEDAREVGQLDTAVTTAVLDTGAFVTIDNCWLSRVGYDQRLEVHGDEGTLFAANEVRDTTVVADAEGFHAPALPHFFLDRYAPAFARELEAFAAALDGAPVPVTGRDGRQALAASLAAIESARTGCAVRL